MKLKRNKEFKIKVQAGTNLEMTNDEFSKEILEGLAAAELLINSFSGIRVHFDISGDEDLRLAKKWTPEKTQELVEKIQAMG